MGSSERGGISKLIIKAYLDNQFSAAKGEYTASINPEDISITSGIDYHLSQGMGTPGTLRYNTSAPKILSFKLLFDNTGIIPGSEPPVEEQLEQLKKVIYDVQENINSPYYVRIIWGVIDFKGRLADLDITYTRFKAEGLPIRAEAFIRVIEEVEATFAPKSSTQPISQSSAAPSQASQQAQGSDSTSPSAFAEEQAVLVGGTAAGAAGGATAASVAAGGPTADSAAGGPTTGSAPGGSAAGSAPGAQTADSVGMRADDGTEGLTADKARIHEVKEGESLASISQNALKNPALAPDLAAINNLDSLRGLTPGLKLALPLSLAALLAALLKKGLDYAKKGATQLKEKGAEAYQAGKEKVGATKDKVKENT